MQTHGGSAAEEAITRSDRRFVHEILVDWNQNGLYDHPLSDLSEYADNIELDRQLAGTAPAEILLIEGAAAAELSFDVSGEYNGLPLTGVFSPYNAASPFFGEEMVGAEITYRIGVETALGVVWYPQFVGNVRLVTPQRAGNVVSISALDRVEKLRRPVLLPPWAVSDIHVNFGELDSQLCRSHWVIDHCLRLCGVSPTPKRPITPEEFADMLPEPVWEGEGLLFWLTGNGSYLPTIGYLDNPSAMTFPADGTPMYTQTGPKHPDAAPEDPRPLALAALGTPIRDSGQYISPASYQGVIRYWMETRDLPYPGPEGMVNERPNASHYFGFTINTNGPNGQLYRTVDLHTVMEVMLGHYFTLYAEVEKGKIRTRFRRHKNNVESQLDRIGQWVDLPTGVDHIDVFIVWDLSDSTNGFSWRMKINDYDTGDVAAGSWVPAHLGNYDAIGGRISIGQALSLSDMFYSCRDAFNPVFNTNRVWRPAEFRAQLDIGKNRFTSMPYFEPKEAWDIITEVAAAEMGAVFWDEEGVFRFWNLDTIQQKQGTVVRRFSTDETSDLVITNSLDSVRNIYTITAKRQRAVINRTIFEADDPHQFYIPARTVRHFRIWADGVQSPLPFKLTRYVSEDGNPFAPYWTDAVLGGYCCQWFENNQWAERPEFISGVDINVYFTKDGALMVRIWNGYNLDARLASGITNSSRDQSQAAFRIQGTQIIDDPEATVWVRDEASINKYGARTLELSGDWYQDTVEGSALIQQLIQRTSIPTPTTDAIEIAGDPRLQLGDTIALYDQYGLGKDVRLQILGINRRYDKDNGLTDTLTVEMVNPSGRPPQVDAGEDITLMVGERRKLTGTYLDYGAPNVSTQWEIIDGPDRVGETVSGVSYDFIPSAQGQYVLQFSLSSDYGSASDTLVVTAVPQSSGGGPVGRPSDPGEALWIGRTGGNWYNIGRGIPTGHEDKSWQEIRDGFSDPERFYLNDDGNVEFRVKITEGRTSSNTKYPRTELREWKENNSSTSAGTGGAAWNGSSGTHWMKGRSRVKQVTQVKPWVCFFQIHDADSDLIRIQTEKKSSGSGLCLVARYTPNGGSEQRKVIMETYQLGQWVDWYIEVVNGRCRVLLDGQEVLNVTNMGRSGCYFKHGAYAQSAVNNVTDTESGNGNQWFVVETEAGSFQTWHTGYAAPTTPDWMTGGTPPSTDPFRRLYLSNASSDWMPGGGPGPFWDITRPDAYSAAKALTALPAGPSVAPDLTETSSSQVTGLIRQFISGPADAPGTLKGKLRVGFGAFESSDAANMTVAGAVWVSEGETLAIRGGSAATFVGTAEISTVAAGWQLELDLDEIPVNVDFQAGDRLVLEMGFYADNTSTSSYTYTMYHGGDGVRDLKPTDTDMTLPGWIDYQTSGGSFGGTSGVIEDPGNEPNPVDGVQAAVVHGWGQPLEEWSDEFDYEGTPDPEKWSLPGEDWEGHGGNGRRRPERQVVQDGRLIMTGLANGDSGWMRSLFDSENGGRWEVRARSYQGAPSAGEPDSTSNGNDYHPVLLIWPQSNSRSQDGEYDFAENSVPGDTKAVAFMHYPDDPSDDDEVEQERFEKPGVDMSQWHNFAFEYKRGTGGYVRGYLDGELWFEHSGGGGPNGRRDIQDMPAGHLCIQLDNFDGEDQTPATFEIEWVRIYDIEGGEDPGGGGDIESFGKQTAGESTTSSTADKLIASPATATGSGTLVAGHGRLWTDSGTTKARMVIYSDSSGSPGTRLAVSDEITVGSGAGAVRDFTFSGANRIQIQSGTTYWIGLMWDDPGSTNVIYSRGSTSNQRAEAPGVTYPNAPNSFGTPNWFSGPIDAWADYVTD